MLYCFVWKYIKHQFLYQHCKYTTCHHYSQYAYVYTCANFYLVKKYFIIWICNVLCNWRQYLHSTMIVVWQTSKLCAFPASKHPKTTLQENIDITMPIWHITERNHSDSIFVTTRWLTNTESGSGILQCYLKKPPRVNLM